MVLRIMPFNCTRERRRGRHAEQMVGQWPTPRPTPLWSFLEGGTVSSPLDRSIAVAVLIGNWQYRWCVKGRTLQESGLMTRPTFLTAPSLAALIWRVVGSRRKQRVLNLSTVEDMEWRNLWRRARRRRGRRGRRRSRWWSRVREASWWLRSRSRTARSKAASRYA